MCVWWYCIGIYVSIPYRYKQNKRLHYYQIAWWWVSIPYRYKQNLCCICAIHFLYRVSIPYRYKQNLKIRCKKKRRIQVSIPYRYKQNTVLSKEELEKVPQFQSPIGTNKTKNGGRNWKMCQCSFNPL